MVNSGHNKSTPYPIHSVAVPASLGGRAVPAISQIVAYGFVDKNNVFWIDYSGQCKEKYEHALRSNLSSPYLKHVITRDSSGREIDNQLLTVDNERILMQRPRAPFIQQAPNPPISQQDQQTLARGGYVSPSESSRAAMNRVGDIGRRGLPPLHYYPEWMGGHEFPDRNLEEVATQNALFADRYASLRNDMNQQQQAVSGWGLGGTSSTTLRPPNPTPSDSPSLTTRNTPYGTRSDASNQDFGSYDIVDIPQEDDENNGHEALILKALECFKRGQPKCLGDKNTRFALSDEGIRGLASEILQRQDKDIEAALKISNQIFTCHEPNGYQYNIQYSVMNPNQKAHLMEIIEKSCESILEQDGAQNNSGLPTIFEESSRNSSSCGTVVSDDGGRSRASTRENSPERSRDAQESHLPSSKPSPTGSQRGGPFQLSGGAGGRQS